MGRKAVSCQLPDFLTRYTCNVPYDIPFSHAIIFRLAVSDFLLGVKIRKVQLYNLLPVRNGWEFPSASESGAGKDLLIFTIRDPPDSQTPISAFCILLSD